MRKPNPNDFDWTDAAVERLKELWAEGHTGLTIGRQFGISRSAVIGKISRLGLSHKPRPRLPTVPLQAISVPKPVRKGQKRSETRPLKRNNRPLPPPEPYQAPRPPPDPPIGSFDLLELRHGHCRWPSAGDGPKWTFCGRPRAGESSYCEAHHALAHNRGSQRDYDRMAEQALAGKLFASRAGVDEA
jgi:GcrA cell cycle regulator